MAIFYILWKVAETEMVKVVSDAGIKCPIPELDVYGSECSIQRLPIEKHSNSRTTQTKQGQLMLHKLNDIWQYFVKEKQNDVIMFGDTTYRLKIAKRLLFVFTNHIVSFRI